MGNPILNMPKLIRNKKGQGALETAAVFVIIFLLIGGILNIWFWANNQITSRQVSYNNSRVLAGTGTNNYTKPVMWDYTPPSLTEDMVMPNN